MHRHFYRAFFHVGFFACAIVPHAERIELDAARRQAVLDHLLPLPQNIELGGAVRLQPGEVHLAMSGKHPVELRLRRELDALMGTTESAQTASPDKFTIHIGLADANGQLDGHALVGAAALKSAAHPDQAYLMEPDGERALYIAALQSKGLFYAGATLKQLLAAGQGEAGLDLPLATITDWPDIDERGVWNFPWPDQWLPWMASLKLNYGNDSSVNIQTIKRDVANRAKIDLESSKLAEALAFNYIPQIIHLNFMEDYGLFSAYPELAGMGDKALAGRYFAHKRGHQHRAPDAGNPLLTKIITEWMMDIASQGAMDVACWLTERPAEDQRPSTTAVGQFVLEGRAYINAWRETRKTYPDFKIRMFVSTVSEERYYKLYAEMPEEMKIIRCCFTDFEQVRHLPRDLFRDPLLDQYASEGRWVGTYDVPLNVNGNVETPEYKVPMRSAHRLQNYVQQLNQRGWDLAAGMMAFGHYAKEICGYNISALAEWSWNADGRSTRDFARAWATVNHIKNPAALADWAELMGPVEWDVFDSEYPICYSWGLFTKMIRERERPLLGESIFRYYQSPKSFDEKLQACRQAAQLASQIDDPSFANETRVVETYVRLAKSIWQIGELLSTREVPSAETQADLKRFVAELEQAGKDNVDAIKAWRTAYSPDTPQQPWHERVHDAIKGTEATVRDISEICKYQYIFY